MPKDLQESLDLKIHWLNQLKTLQKSSPNLPIYNQFTRNYLVNPSLDIDNKVEFMALVQYLIGIQICFTDSLTVIAVDWEKLAHMIPRDYWKIDKTHMIYQIMPPDTSIPENNRFGFTNVINLDSDGQDKVLNFWKHARLIIQN